MDAKEFIVATESGLFHKMKQAAPDKIFIEAPTSGNGATCKSCTHCPWMAMNYLANLAEVLEKGGNEIHVDPDIGKKAITCIDRMLAFAAEHKAKMNQPFSGLGPA